MRFLLMPLWLGLLLLCPGACSRPSTLKVTVTGVPAQSGSLSVSLALVNEGEAPVLPEAALAPYELPQPAADMSSFVLRLPLQSDATLLLGVAAFSLSGGSGCVLGLGNASHPYRTAVLDDEVTIALTPQSEDAGAGCTGSPRIVSVTPTALAPAGGEKLQVQGWGFTPGARILLNGEALETQYVSAGLLQATTPASARLMAVPLTVELPGGARASYRDLRYIAKAISFSPLTTFTVPDSDHKVAVADLDGDRRPDLIFYPFANSGDNKTIIAFQRAPLQFTVETPDSMQDLDGLVAVDLDRDGDIDLAAMSGDQQTLKLYFNDGRGNFTLKTQPLSATELAWLCTDLNGDGAPEIAFLDDGSGSSQVLYTLTNDGKGNFAAPGETMTRLTQTQGVYSLAAIDYDVDGHVDLLILDVDLFTVLLNPGAGLPADDGAAVVVQLSDSLGSSFSIQDLDGDEINDLLATDLGGIPLVFLSRSNPPRARKGLRPACESFTYTAGDLDGDGLPETAFGCDYRTEIRFQHQLPSHALVTSTQAPPLSYEADDTFVFDLELADLDGDGRRDLLFGITPNYTDDPTQYRVYRNVSQ